MTGITVFGEGGGYGCFPVFRLVCGLRVIGLSVFPCGGLDYMVWWRILIPSFFLGFGLCPGRLK